MTRNILYAGIFILIAAPIMWFTFGAFEREMCYRLKEQAGKNYNGFYITALDSDECNALGIAIDAPIK